MRLLPRGLFGRLVLILLCGLIFAQLVTAYLNLSERDQLLYRASGMQTAQRIADVSKLLDSVPAAERRRIVAVFNAPPLAISLDRPRMAPDRGPPETDLRVSMFETVLGYALGEGLQVQVVRAAGAPERYAQRAWKSPPGMPMMQGPMSGGAMSMMHPESRFFVVQVVLRDGTVVTFDSFVSPEAAGMPLRLALTLLVLLGTVVSLSPRKSWARTSTAPRCRKPGRSKPGAPPAPSTPCRGACRASSPTGPAFSPPCRTI